MVCHGTRKDEPFYSTVGDIGRRGSASLCGGDGGIQNDWAAAPCGIRSDCLVSRQMMQLLVMWAAEDVDLGDPGVGGASSTVVPRSCSGGLVWWQHVFLGFDRCSELLGVARVRGSGRKPCALALAAAILMVVASLLGASLWPSCRARASGENP
jgi:hypothetical protein